jgi:hypothetical protein
VVAGALQGVEVVGAGVQEADLAGRVGEGVADGERVFVDSAAAVESNRGHGVVVSPRFSYKSERLSRPWRGRSCGAAHWGNPRPHERQPHVAVNPADAWPTVRRRQPEVLGFLIARPVMKPTLSGPAILLTAILVTACSRGGYPGSGLPDTLLAESLLEQVGATQGVKIVDRGGGGGKDLRSHEVHSQFSVAITSGTTAELLTGLRAEMQRLILASGETIFGLETVVPAGLRDFAFHYANDHHKGVLRIYTADTSTNTFRLIMFCYEHQINGPLYER